MIRCALALIFVAALACCGTVRAASTGHTCVLATGGATCWGKNDKGQLGRPVGDETFPAFVAGMGANSGVAGVAVGLGHTCAIQEDDVLCWGDNAAGQLGRAGPGSSTPGKVQGLPAGTPALIASGDSHSCVAFADSVWCWGADGRGQLGNGAEDGGHVPHEVVDLGDVVTIDQLAAGRSNTCIAASTATSHPVRCMGDNLYFQLGVGDAVTESESPVQVLETPSKAAALAVGSYHACVAFGSNTRCWGSNYRGQLGTSNDIDAPFPVVTQVPGIGVKQLVAGQTHTCALRVDGTAFCWGANDLGQVGDATNTDRNSPQFVTHPQLAGMPNFNELAFAAGNHSCVRNSGDWYCWGSGEHDQLGVETEVDALTPVTVMDDPNTPGGAKPTIYQQAEPMGLELGSAHTCAFGVEDGVNCWGKGSRQQLSFFVDEGEIFRDRPFATPANLFGLEEAQYALTNESTCIRSAVGGVTCVGANESGQAGNGSFTDDDDWISGVSGLYPFGSASLGRVISIEAGARHVCAVLEDQMTLAHTGMCWGADGYGQLGDGFPDPASNIPLVVTMPSIDRFSAGQDHTCAFYPNKLLCWGSNLFGQLGDGTFENRSEPQPYTEVIGLGPDDVLQLDSGKFHNCATLVSGGVKCWGYNENGQLGVAPSTRIPTPGVVPDLVDTPVEAIATGAFHTCVIVEGGVKCWGLNERGQLGDGTRTTRETPAWVAGLEAGSGASAIGAGDEHTCAAVGPVGNRTVRCWGNGLNGRLGNGTLGYEMVPVLAPPPVPAGETDPGTEPGVGSIFEDGFE